MGGIEYAQWYVVRDLKQCNTKRPAYKQLQEAGVKVSIPLKWQIVLQKGKKVREKVLVIQDLLFVYDPRQHLGSIVERTKTLQHRWLRNTFREPMTVSGLEMDRFVQAISSSDSPKYYLPERITPQMCGRKVRIIGGSLNGYRGCLFKIRGSKIEHLLVELKSRLAVGVEILPEYIQFARYDIYDYYSKYNGQS